MSTPEARAFYDASDKLAALVKRLHKLKAKRATLPPQRRAQIQRQIDNGEAKYTELAAARDAAHAAFKAALNTQSQGANPCTA